MESLLSSLHQARPLPRLYQSKNSVHSANKYSLWNNPFPCPRQSPRAPALQGTFQRPWGLHLELKDHSHWLCFLLPSFQRWAGEVVRLGRRTVFPTCSALVQSTENCLVSQGCSVIIAHSLPNPFTKGTFDDHFLLLQQLSTFGGFTSLSLALLIPGLNIPQGSLS